MRNKEETQKEFLRLKAEGEAIKKEVEDDKTLTDLDVTPKMDKEMARIIKAYDEERSNKFKII